MKTDNAPAPQPAPRPDLRRFRRELTPTWISAALVCDSVHPLPVRSPLRTLYLDGSSSLGGTTAPVVAACHPDADVTVWSAEPSAVAGVRTLRDAVGITNLTVHESSTPPDTDDVSGPVDLVVIDSVLDAVDDDMRSRVLGCVASTLRPGGVVCVRHRTTVGWSEIVPVIRLIRHAAALEGASERAAFARCLDLVEQMRAGGAAYLTERPVVAAWLDELSAMPTDDGIETCLRRDLRPLSHAQVRAAMTSIGCEHIGSAEVGDALGDDLPPGTAQLTDRLEAPLLKEVFEDLSTKRSHRTDLFQFGVTVMNSTEQRQVVDSIELLALSLSHDADPAGVDPQHRTEDHASAAFRTLQQQEGPVTLKVLESDRTARIPLLRRLMADGLAHPTAARPSGSMDSDLIVRLGRIVGHPPFPASDRIVVSPVIASAITATDLLRRDDMHRLGAR